MSMGMEIAQVLISSIAVCWRGGPPGHDLVSVSSVAIRLCVCRQRETGQTPAL